MKKQLSRKSHDFTPLIDAELEKDLDYVTLKKRHGDICNEIVKLREERDQVASEVSLVKDYPDEASAIAAGALPVTGRPVALRRESVSSINNRLHTLEQAATKILSEMISRKQALVHTMYRATFREEQLAVADEMVDALLFFGEQTSVETSRLFDLQRAGITMAGYARVGIPRLASAAAIAEYLQQLKAIGYQPSLEQQQRVDALRKFELENAR